MITILQVVVGVAIIAALVAFALILTGVLNRKDAARAARYHDLEL